MSSEIYVNTNKIGKEKDSVFDSFLSFSYAIEQPDKCGFRENSRIQEAEKSRSKYNCSWRKTELQIGVVIGDKEVLKVQ